MTTAARPRTVGKPLNDVQREVRFAAVLYGGVSLAIYMNGVTQELLRLVRASAPGYEPDADPKDPPKESTYVLLGPDELKSTESVYRKIAQHLGERGDWKPEQMRAAKTDDPIRTRFVIDVLSGTSAGGINSIFLAKAIAFGLDLEPIGRLWLDQGDVAELLNDRPSWSRKKPESLLDSRYMYDQLKKAFDKMDAGRTEGSGTKFPQLGRDVDLFITTTDIKGLPLVLRLADRVVAERRHRNVFHLRYVDGTNGQACNDFSPDVNPFLAFIARCTSSFPVAFEPMTVGDIPGSTPANVPKWDEYFPAYTGMSDERSSLNAPGGLGTDNLNATPWPTTSPVPLISRAFGDGGFLDNKPFEYAIDAIAQRGAGVAVERKLLYLEPSPEHPERDIDTSGRRPNAVETANAALSLARYETIRSDLQRVLALNRTVERVERITSGIDDDLTTRDRRQAELDARDNGPVTPAPAAEPYALQDVNDGIDTYGSAYGGYHRLKVSALTDELTEYVARVAGFNEDSDYFAALRYLIGAWRSKWYCPVLTNKKIPLDPPAGTVVESENAFILRYDIGHRIRRLSFLIRRIDVLRTDPTLRAVMLERRGIVMPGGAGNERDFNEYLRSIRPKLSSWLTELRKHRALLMSRKADVNPIAEPVGKLGLDPVLLRGVLSPATDAQRQMLASSIVEDDKMRPRLAQFEMALRSAVDKTTQSRASEVVRATIGQPLINHGAPSAGEEAALKIVRLYYNDYESYDQLTFPAFFATDIGDEGSTVDVSRVSPEDAPSLIDEGNEPRRKLAGNVLMNFGAFLDRRWRWNDILWGRLDGAERLITTLLPGDAPSCREVRQDFITEAHGIILEEELRKHDAGDLEWLPSTKQQPVLELFELPHTAPLAERRRLQKLVVALFKEHYEVNREYKPRETMESAARATRIVGQMLDGMTDRYAALKKPAAWVTRIGGIAWGLIEVAVPRSFARLAAGHWFKLLYAFEVVLIAAGVVMSDGTIRNFGLTALTMTLATHLVVAILGDIMSRKQSWIVTAKLLIGLAVVLLTMVGITTIMVPPLRADVWREMRTPTGEFRWLRDTGFAMVLILGGWALILAVGAGDYLIRLVGGGKKPG